MQSTFVILVTLGCISAVSTDQCYTCISDLNSGCADPFDRNSVGATDKMDLPPGGACVKTRFKHNGVIHITRAATPQTSVCSGNTNSCTKHRQDGQTGIVCCCTGNLCNGVSTLSQQTLTILFFPIATFIYRQF